MTLQTAGACLDCETLRDIRDASHCPGCGGSSFYPIANWLDRVAPIGQQTAQTTTEV